MIIYAIIHTICAFLFIIFRHKDLDKESDQGDTVFCWFAFWPVSLLVFLAIWLSNFFNKQKPKPIVPWTCGGYLWWEVVMVGDEKGIVIDYSWMNKIQILLMNSSVTRWVDVSEITSTTKPSELVEELAMLDQANKLLSKADAIVKEAGEIKMKVVKKRTNLIYSPK